MQGSGEIGRLAEHDVLFETFGNDVSTRAAHFLLQQIGVSRTDLEREVRGDPDHLAHCQRRTQMYQTKANVGVRRFQRLLKDRRVCDEHGNWHGDLSEALSTLYGARLLGQVRKSRNVQFLNRAGLMFDAMLVGDEQFCFLYPQKWHAAFRRALHEAKS